MNERLLELGIRGQLMAADLASVVASRARSERGQTVVEWIALMVGLAALVTVLVGKTDVWRQAGDTIVNAARDIFGSSNDKV